MSKQKNGSLLKFPGHSLKGKMTKKEKDQLIIECMPLVRLVAKKVALKTPPNVEFDDLVSCGVIGLMDAIEKFDPGRQIKFKTYAEHRVKGAILDELRAQDWVPRSVRNKEKLVERSLQKLESSSCRKVAFEDVRKDLKMDHKDFHQLIQKVQRCKVLRIDDFPLMNHQEKKYLTNYMKEQDEENPAYMATYNSSREYILTAMENLTDNEQIILELYYFENQNIKEISSRLGITESRVSQLHVRAKGKMKNFLGGHFDGPTDMCA